MPQFHARHLTSLAERIHNDIDAYCVRTMSDEHRNHMGASVIGHDCDAHIWYAFRWAKKEVFSGRQLRLFERGKLEEARITGYLRGIGFNISDVDDTGKQFKIADATGHYGGSTDGLGIPPYPEFPIKMVCEFKTHNAGSFKLLRDKGVILSKPRHWAQMNSYGKGFQIEYGLYVGVGKNDDDLWIECLPLDYSAADDLHRRAERLIRSQVRPTKIALNPSHFDCKMCAFLDQCHHGKPLERNCRSCVYAHAIEGAQWGCEFHKIVIPSDFIPQGCANWKPIA
jgi:hypothetical protein